MRNAKTITLIIIMVAAVLGLVPLSETFAAGGSFEGDISLKGMLTDVNGSEAKFNEYRDLTDGLYGRIRLKYDTDAYFMKFQAFDIGYDTQKYSLGGGMWGIFRYNLYYKEIPHNITFGARSFFRGIGGDDLTGAPNENEAAWKKFDYSTERRQYGAGFKLDLLKPFFFDVAVSREEKEGIKPTAGNSGFSTTELPEPVDYTTDTLKVEAGYAKKPFFASLGYVYSRFDKEHRFLSFTNPFGGFQDAITLPPDNRYHKLAFKGALFLPLNSKISLNVGSSIAKSDADLLDPATSLSSGRNFDGSIETTNLDLILTTTPVTFMDAKVFYKYYDRDNQSDIIDDGVVNSRFSYTKRSRGLELGFRLPAKFYLSGSYKNLTTKFNERPDVNGSNNDIYAVNLRWTGLDVIAFRTGYERVNRGMDSVIQDDPARRFDVAPMHRDSFKVYVDISPMDSLNFTFGYIYRKSDYRNMKLGLLDDKRDEFTVDADFAIGKVAKLFGYFDYERIRYNQQQQEFSEWQLEQKEKTFDFGAGTDIYLIPKKLTLKVQYDHIMSNGNADFTLSAAELFGGRNNDNIDISNSDDYRKEMFTIKAIYDVMKSITLTAGYVYEKYKFSDAQLDDYQHVINPGGFGADTYLTGAFKDQNYKANVFFLGLTYKF